jgi:hypothetical protein
MVKATSAFGPFRPFAALQHHGSYWGQTGCTALLAETT